MPIKNPDLAINSLVIINTSQVVAVDSTLENGATQKVINENNTSSINENTAAINTLNNLIEANVNTNGNYFSPSGSITDLSGEIRPILSTSDPLDSNYIIVAVSPEQNLFTNQVNGRVIFNLSIANLINDSVSKTLSIKIYLASGTLIKQIDKLVNADFNGSINLINGIDVSAGSQVYFTFSITSGTGTLTASNQIQYGIEFSSKGTSGNKSSQVINDQNEIPNSGINPKLINIDENKNDLNLIKAGTFNYPQLTLNGNSITEFGISQEPTLIFTKEIDEKMGNGTYLLNEKEEGDLLLNYKYFILDIENTQGALKLTFMSKTPKYLLKNNKTIFYFEGVDVDGFACVSEYNSGGGINGGSAFLAVEYFKIESSLGPKIFTLWGIK